MCVSSVGHVRGSFLELLSSLTLMRRGSECVVAPCQVTKGVAPGQVLCQAACWLISLATKYCVGIASLSKECVG